MTRRADGACAEGIPIATLLAIAIRAALDALVFTCIVVPSPSLSQITAKRPGGAFVC
jgi:hypothetical protein